MGFLDLTGQDLPEDKVPEVAPGVPLVYEVDGNLKVTKKCPS